MMVSSPSRPSYVPPPMFENVEFNGPSSSVKQKKQQRRRSSRLLNRKNGMTFSRFAADAISQKVILSKAKDCWLQSAAVSCLQCKL